MGRLPSIVAIAMLFATGLYAVAWASDLQTFSLTRFLLFFSPLLCCCFVLLLSRDPLLFLLWITLALLPILGVIMPPARLQLSVFDFLAGGLLLLLLHRAILAQRPIEFFPTIYVWIPIAFCIPSILTSIDLANSMTQFYRIVCLYGIYIVCRHYLNNLELIRIFNVVIATSVIIVAATIILQKVAGTSFQLYGDRPFVDANGILVQQGSGIFQDPQKAGQYLAVFAAYLSVLWWQGVFTGAIQKSIVVGALLTSCVALLFTISRLAIASGFGALAISFLFLGWHRIQQKLAVLFVGGLLILSVGIFSERPLINVLIPHDVLQRFETSASSATGRLQIWKDSWQIFENNPLTGVGLGNYQEYWLQKNPAWRRAYESGTHVPDQPENGYLHILYEIGLIGSAGVIFFLLAAFRSFIEKLALPNNKLDRSFALASALASIVYLTTFTTIFTASDARNALIVVCLLVALELNLGSSPHSNRT
jgi:O-antigen ligase